MLPKCNSLQYKDNIWSIYGENVDKSLLESFHGSRCMYVPDWSESVVKTVEMTESAANVVSILRPWKQLRQQQRVFEGNDIEHAINTFYARYR